MEKYYVNYFYETTINIVKLIKEQKKIKLLNYLDKK